MIDLWQEIYGTIRRNKLRTFLTGFAVAWGIFMLIVLLGAGNGIIHAFEESSGERALNSIRVYGGWTTKPYDGLKEGRSIDLDNRDLEDTEAYFTDRVESAGATLYQMATDISYGPEYVNLSLNGVHPNYVEVEAVKVVEGRFVNQTDIRERRKSIVLHRKSADVLFGKTHTDPLGKFVNAGGVAYQVVGIYDDEGSSEPSSAFIPFSTLQTIYNKGNDLNSIIFTTKGLTTEESNEQFEADYRRVIAANHRFDPTDDGAIWLWNRFTNYLQAMAAMGILRTAISRVRHPQGAGREAPQHPVAHHRGERGHHHRLRLRGHGGRHRSHGMDGLRLRQPDRRHRHVRGQDVQQPHGRHQHRHPGHRNPHRGGHTGRTVPRTEGDQDTSHRGVKGRLILYSYPLILTADENR